MPTVVQLMPQLPEDCAILEGPYKCERCPEKHYIVGTPVGALYDLTTEDLHALSNQGAVGFALEKALGDLEAIGGNAGTLALHAFKHIYRVLTISPNSIETLPLNLAGWLQVLALAVIGMPKEALAELGVLAERAEQETG